MVQTNDSQYRHYLKEWREKRGMLQSDLAKLVGCATSVISRYETGDRRIHLEMQFKLFAHLRITPAQFFEPPDDPPIVIKATGATDEERRQIGKLVKAFLSRDDET